MENENYVLIEDLPKGKCIEILTKDNKKYHIFRHKNNVLYFGMLDSLMSYDIFKKLDEDKRNEVVEAIQKHAYYIKIEKALTDTKDEDGKSGIQTDSIVKLKLKVNNYNRILYAIKKDVDTLTFKETKKYKVISFNDLDNEFNGQSLISELRSDTDDEIAEEQPTINNESDSEYVKEIISSKNVKEFTYETKDGLQITIQKLKNGEGEDSVNYLGAIIGNSKKPKPCTIDSKGFLKVLLK